MTLETADFADEHQAQGTSRRQAAIGGEVDSEIVLAAPPGWGIYGPWLGLSVLVGAFAITFVSVEQVVAVEGRIIPAGGEVEVASGTTGVVSEIRVQDGQAVRRGDVLMVLAGGRAQATGSDVSATVHDLIGTQITAIQNQKKEVAASYLAQAIEGRTRLQAARREAESQRRQVQLSAQRHGLVETQVNQMKSLVDRGFGSRLELARRQEALLAAAQDLEGARSRAAGADDEIAVLQSQLQGIEARERSELAVLTASIADLQGRLALHSLERGEAVRAPASGVISHVYARPGARSSPTTVLASLIPDGDRLEGEMLISPEAARFVRQGDRIWLRVEAFPYQRYGEVAARVVSMSASAVPVRGTVEESEPPRMYVATVELTDTRQELEGRGIQLGSEMPVTASIGAGALPLWRLALDSFSGRRPSGAR